MTKLLEIARIMVKIIKPVEILKINNDYKLTEVYIDKQNYITVRNSKGKLQNC